MIFAISLFKPLLDDEEKNRCKLKISVDKKACGEYDNGVNKLWKEETPVSHQIGFIGLVKTHIVLKGFSTGGDFSARFISRRICLSIISMISGRIRKKTTTEIW